MTTPQMLSKATLTCQAAGCESPVAVFTRHVSRADWRTLQNYGEELLQTLSKTGPDDIRMALGDINQNYYRFVWIGRDNTGGPAVQSAIVHVGEEESITSIPGITASSRVQLIDILVSADPAAILDTQYLSTRKEDPLAAQIPAFVQKTDVLGFLAGLPLARGEDTRTVSTTYTLSRAVLPYKRADIRIRDTIVVPGSAASLRTAGTELRDRLVIRDARLSPCAQQLAAADAEAISAAASEGSCVIPPGQAPGLTTDQANACRSAMTRRLEDTYRQAVMSCRETPPAVGFDPMTAVDKQFTDLAGTLRETRRTAETKITDVPHTRYSFGVLSAAIIGEPTYFGSAIRAKVGSNGLLIHDPLPTVLSMAIINIHPRAYDADADVPTSAERVRLFVGTTITPEFGIGGGAGFMLVRGLSVTAGWANLFIDTPRSGLSIGDVAPKTVSDPLSIGRAGVFFAGLSYSFR
jgi:hypothetical protein